MSNINLNPKQPLLDSIPLLQSAINFENPQIQSDDSISLTYKSYKSGNSSDCNSLGVDMRNISAKELLVDPIYQPNSKDEQMQIKPEEREFYNILLA